MDFLMANADTIIQYKVANIYGLPPNSRSEEAKIVLVAEKKKILRRSLAGCDGQIYNDRSMW